MALFFAIAAIMFSAAAWSLFSRPQQHVGRQLIVSLILLAVMSLAYLGVPLWQYLVLGAAGLLLALSGFSGRAGAKLLQLTALLVTGAAAALGYLFPLYEQNLTSGKYQVGHVVHYHDMRGQQTHISAQLEDYRVPVKIWFPTKEPGEQSAGFDDLLIGLKARYSYLPIPAWVLNNLYISETAATNATTVIDEKLPVVVYNHGGGSYPEDNRVLLEEIASNGYIAVSIGHPLSSSAIRYPGGVLLAANYDAYGRTSLSRAQQVQLNEKWEIAFSVGSYEEYFELISEYILTPDPSTQLVSDWIVETMSVTRSLPSIPVIGESVDLNRIAFAGYSLGGATAIELCRHEAICRAVINLDGLPAASPGIMEADLGKPLLVFTSNNTAGSVDKYTPNQFLAVNNSADSYNILIPEATHSQFSSDGYYAPAFNIGHGYSNAVYHRTQDIVRDLILDFLDRHMAGKATKALPDSSSAVFVIHH